MLRFAIALTALACATAAAQTYPQRPPGAHDRGEFPKWELRATL